METVTWRQAFTKSAAYRVLSFMVTGAITWLVTGSVGVAGVVALADGLAKLVGYAAFEKAWQR